ncbi:MAG: class I SAM-dependent methyltransferase [Vicinamibacterales bacterium]|nr:class I SAM-dependent methyltransferase [Vicinamibacterales bacterium]
MNPEYAGARAREYDHGMDVLFQTFGVDEAALREEMVALLRLPQGARILETGCGTGRDTVHLATRAGVVYATDLSPDMIQVGRARLAEAGATAASVRHLVADATALPFSDGSFDAAYHFGGLNLFPDVRRGLAEMARVVKVGGRVVCGDEGVAPWLTESEFGKILVNSNPFYRHQAPLHLLPVAARDVACRWILGGAFYLLDFTVGQGEPPLDLDVEFPGARGGSHRTRYYGRLDGVSPDLRQQVMTRAAADGLSLTAWLEKALAEKLAGR